LPAIFEAKDRKEMNPLVVAAPAKVAEVMHAANLLLIPTAS
jgi:hypothetical protein